MSKTPKARHKRLLEAGFFPPEMPSCFYSASFGASLDALLTEFDKLPSKNGNPNHYYYKSEKASFNFPRFGRQDRRHSYINPVAYFFLSKVLADEFDAIQIEMQKSRLSITPIEFEGAGERAVKRPVFESRSQAMAALNARFEVIGEADIAGFYHSIYTHSIAWAIHGKSAAKKKKTDLSLAGNVIDLLVRNAQDGQTIGIPVGPDTSRMIGEIVGSAIDRVLQDLIEIPPKSSKAPTAIRFVDDFTFGCSSVPDAEEKLAAVRTIINSFELELNSGKTGINPASPFVAPAWGDYLKGLVPTHPCTASDIKCFLYRVEMVGRDNLKADVVKYALRIATSLFIEIDDWAIVQDYLLSAYRRSATVLPQLVEILILRELSKKDVDKELLTAFINSRIPALAARQKNGEVIWLLHLAISLKLQLGDAMVRQLLTVEDGAIALLLADAKNKGLFASAVPFTHWNSFLTTDGLNGSMWLYVYESTLKAWNGSTSVAHVTGHPYFSHLDSRTKCNAVKRLTEKLVWCLESQSLSRSIIQQVLNDSKFSISHR